MSGMPAKHVYEFGPFRLDPAEHTLLREGQPVPLAPKIFDILTLLVERSGHLFGKDEVMQAVWPDSFVEEGNLTRNISTLRTALGENLTNQYIETVPKRGYRFVGPVKEVAELPEAGNITSSVAERVEAVASFQGKAPGANESISNPRWSWRRSFESPRVLPMLALATFILVGVGYALFFRKAPGGRQPEIKSLAVLPLRSLSRAKDDEYLGLGLADTIIARVSQINDLTVRPTSAVRKYSNQQINSLEAARELQVDSVLDGAMQRAGDHLRINLNLLRTQDGASLWSYTFDLNPTDTFKMQDEVSQQVATRLRLQLRPQKAATHTINAEAYDDYLRAKFHGGLQNPNDNEAAIKLLEHATTIDQNFAAAYAALAQEYRNRAFALKPQEKEWEEKAYTATERALSLDPDLAEAHVARGLLLWTHSNHFPHALAVQEFRRALDLNPNLDEAHHQLASVYNHIGLLDKAAEEIQKAVAINPGNTGARFRVGVNLLYQGKDEQALAAFRDSEKFNPAVWAYQIACALFHLGRKEEAAARVAEALKNNPQDEGGTLTSMEALLAASAGDAAAAEAKIKRAAELGKGYGHFHHTAYTIACAYALLNKAEPAMRWLQMAADDGFPCYPLFERDPNLNNLRRDQRFIAFMAKLKEQCERYQATL